jgi:REP element-mobilizing transposase RayT
MARKARTEVEGGLYHVITRGNNRRQIFNSPADYEKFLFLLAVQKIKLPFFLYAYCLMTNHVHLLLERQASAVGRIMHRLLTGYAQYYNRRYRRVGHLLQGRHKAILCQSERYLSELVRYIHLNPVRAGMVTRPEDYELVDQIEMLRKKGSRSARSNLIDWLRQWKGSVAYREKTFAVQASARPPSWQRKC